jgi:predicted permease
MLNDVRYGLRVLLKSPAFTSVAVLSLALGIGGGVSVFTLLNAIVLRDLPVPNPQQLYVADRHSGSVVANRYSWPMFVQLRDEIHGRAEAFVTTNPTTMQVRLPRRSDAAAAERSMVQLVSGEFFGVLRQRARLGRLIEPRDNTAPGANPVVVLSDAYWQRRFDRDPNIIGRDLVVGGATLTVIGVAEPEFFGPVVALRNAEVWIPLMMQHEIRYAFNASMSDDSDGTKPWAPQPEINWLSLFLRVPNKPAVGTIAATATVVHQRDATSRLASSSEDDRARVQRERIVLTSAGRGVSFLRGDLSSRLAVLLAMMGVLLLITCGNVASLLIARASAREREVAVRAAIGAPRWRIMRQLLVENVVLAFVGGTLGLLAAAWGRDLLLSMFARGATIIDLNTTFDWRVLLFATLITTLCGLAAGVLPAIRSTRVSPTDAIKAQARQVGHSGGRRGALIGKTLVAGQIAFCLLLLVVAGLFVRSMQSLMTTDVGYDRDHLLVAQMDVRTLGYPDHARQALYARLLDRLRGVPGVLAASASLNGPMSNSRRSSSLAVEGYTAGTDEALMTNEEVVTPDYFAAVGLKLLEGRLWTMEDVRAGGRSTIINQSMARRFFASDSAIGKRWTYGEPVTSESWIIIGVVEDAKYFDVRSPTPNMIYRLAVTAPAEVLGNLEIRTIGAPELVADGVRQAVAEVEPALLVFDLVPLDQRVNRGLTNDRLIANLTSTFGLVALLLACLGLYGTISYGVARRISELGVRMALGAGRKNVLWMVIRESLALVAVGAVVGIPLAFIAGRSLMSFLHGVDPIDPVSFAQATALLVGVAGLAAYVPAYRASQIDPMVALRSE